jgi:hypothetical protein
MTLGLKGGREINIKVTLDEKDAAVLEIAAGVMKKTPDEVLDDLLTRSVQEQLKEFLAGIREVARKHLEPTQQKVLQALGIAQEFKRNHLRRR